MTLEGFHRTLEERGGEADIFVVYLEDAYETTIGEGFRLTPQKAFWTRGAAYAYSYKRNALALWHHLYVFRLHADAAWAAGTTLRALEFETVFTRANDLRRITVTPEELADLLDE